MEAIAHAARLNSEGILLMNEGADLESAKALTEALTVMQSQLVRDTLLSSSANNGTTPQMPSSSSQPQPRIEFAETGISLISSSSLFILNRGIYFIPTTEVSQSSVSCCVDKDMAHVCCVSILFNLALLYHKRALLNNNNNSDNCFRKADDLYRKITLILGYPNSFDDVNTQDDRLNSLSDSASIIMIAAINNMSQIRYEKGHYDLAEDSIRALSHILQISSPNIQSLSIPVIQGGSNTNTTQSQSQCESSDFWNQIVLNVLLLKQPSLAAAA